MLTVGSTFTGVGGADLGFEAAGFKIAWQCELDPWKRSILAAHWPSIPIYEDVARLCVEDWIDNPEPVDVMIGGFPCQDLSIAGKRKGFSGERSVLAFEFLRVAETLKPRWLVLENVPGLLSSNKGLDFQRLLSEVAACGYGVGYRCLDARYFGVPQRRRRIFVVARRAEAGVDPRAASGLALRALCESSSGDSTPGWPPRPLASANAGGGADEGGIFNATASFGAWVEDEAAGTLSRRDYKSPNHLLIDPIMFGHTQGIDIQPSAKNAPTLRVGGNGAAVCFRKSKRAQSDKDDETWVESEATNTLNRFDTGDTRATQLIAPTLTRYNLDSRSPQSEEQQRIVGAVHDATTTVRRLTPIECERLMGWPDNWTAPDGVKAPDSKRYSACGDGIVSWVAYWIGQRIRMIEEETCTGQPTTA